MTNPTASQIVNASGADTLTFSTALTTLANTGISVPSGAVDNRGNPATPVLSYDLGDLELVFSNAFTPAAGGYITVGSSVAPDGANYASPPGASAQAAQIQWTQSFPVLAVSTTRLILPNLMLYPYLTQFIITNLTGTTWASGITTITAKLYRRSVAMLSV